MSNDMASTTRAVSVRNLAVHRGDRLALIDIDIDLCPGETLAILGANGSGKSTLLQAITGLVSISSGSVDCHRRSTALVLQATDVDRSLPISVREAVRLARYANLGLFRRFSQADFEAVDHAMARMAVGHLAERQLHELSGGQRQRVLVAQGLAQQADILLLDEPASGLDAESRQLILDAIAEEREAARTVVMATHSLDDARRCDRVLLLATRAIAFGSPSEVIQDSVLDMKMLDIDAFDVCRPSDLEILDPPVGRFVRRPTRG